MLTQEQVNEFFARLRVLRTQVHELEEFLAEAVSSEKDYMDRYEAEADEEDYDDDEV